MADLESSGVLVLGLDPGGQGQFGWCVAGLGTGPRPIVRLVGTADHAAGALSDIREHVGDLARIVAAGMLSGKRPKPLMLQAGILNRSLFETLTNVMALNEEPTRIDRGFVACSRAD